MSDFRTLVIVCYGDSMFVFVDPFQTVEKRPILKASKAFVFDGIEGEHFGVGIETVFFDVVHFMKDIVKRRLCWT